MDFVYRVLYLILIYISGVTLFFAPIGLIFSWACLRNMHFSLRVLMFCLGIQWCILPIGGLCYAFIVDSPLNPSPSGLYALTWYQIAKNICAITGYAFRVTETAICAERLLATVYFETYETIKKFRAFPYFAILIAVLIATSFSLLFNILHVHASVIWIFLVIVETINFILLHILKKQNYKLRQLSNSNRALLSSKYQLIENIKSLNLLFPQAIISFVISNFTLVSTVYIREFVNEGYAPPLFYILYNINVMIISMYWFLRSPWTKMKIAKFRQTCTSRVNTSTEVVVMQVTTVKTALGQTINGSQNVEDYFNCLKSGWK